MNKKAAPAGTDKLRRTIPGLGYEFHNARLLEIALTHSSYLNGSRESGDLNNERLEFLGDALVDAIISEELYRKHRNLEEGRLTKIRAAIVCEESLAVCAKKLKVGAYLRLSRGEESGGGRQRNSILADAMEAIVAAIYLDGDWEAARKAVLHHFAETLELAASGKLHKDYKTALQEELQKNGDAEIRYTTDREEGPDHNKTFYVSVWSKGRKLGEGQGHSKKEAEQKAAAAGLQQLSEETDKNEV